MLAGLFHHGLPPRRLCVGIVDLRNRAQDQGSLSIGDENPHIVRFSNLVPPDQIVGHDPVDEEREFAPFISLPPPLLPVFDDFRDAVGIFSFVGPVGLHDGRAKKRGGGQLLGFVHTPCNVHFDPACRLHGDFLEVSPGRLP